MGIRPMGILRMFVVVVSFLQIRAEMPKDYTLPQAQDGIPTLTISRDGLEMFVLTSPLNFGHAGCSGPSAVHIYQRNNEKQVFNFNKAIQFSQPIRQIFSILAHPRSNRHLLIVHSSGLSVYQRRGLSAHYSLLHAISFAQTLSHQTVTHLAVAMNKDNLLLVAAANNPSSPISVYAYAPYTSSITFLQVIEKGSPNRIIDLLLSISEDDYISLFVATAFGVEVYEGAMKANDNVSLIPTGSTGESYFSSCVTKIVLINGTGLRSDMRLAAAVGSGDTYIFKMDFPLQQKNQLNSFSVINNQTVTCPASSLFAAGPHLHIAFSGRALVFTYIFDEEHSRFKLKSCYENIGDAWSIGADSYRIYATNYSSVNVYQMSSPIFEDPNNGEEEKEQDGLSGGAIAGIVIGSVAGAILIALLVVKIYTRSLHTKEANAQNKNPSHDFAMTSEANIHQRAV